jgi:serine/threonine protein kinase
LGTNTFTGEKVAIKVLEKWKIRDEAQLNLIKREIKILKLMDHPNIIKLYEIIETPKEIYLVMELCKGGELFDYINKSKRLSEKEARRIFKQLISAVEYLARTRVAHRDIKPENILLDDNKNIKLVDFGLSNTWNKGERLKTACGSPWYAAPEMIAGKQYKGTSTDLWSAGIVLYFMLVGYLPFEDSNTSSLYKKILNANETIEELIPDFLSLECKNFLIKLLNTSPRSRFRLKEIKNHEWYRDPAADDERLFQPRNRFTSQNASIVRSPIEECDDLFSNHQNLKIDLNNTYCNKFSVSRRARNLPLSWNTSLQVSDNNEFDKGEMLTVKMHQRQFEDSPSLKCSEKVKLKRKFLKSIHFKKDQPGLKNLAVVDACELPFISINKSRRNAVMNRSIQDEGSILSAKASTSIYSPDARESTCYTSLDQKSSVMVSAYLKGKE